MRKRRVILLGATGSIGSSAIKVAESIPDRMQIVGMAANRNARLLAEAANRTRPEAICLVDENHVNELRSSLKYSPEILTGESGLETLARSGGPDLLLVAIIGNTGLKPALAAIETRKNLPAATQKLLV